MNDRFRLIHNFFMIEDSEKFYHKKFMHNNLCIFILSVYLTFEQLYYGIFMSEAGSLKQEIFLISACILTGYILISGYIQLRKVQQISWIHKVYEVSLGVAGFSIAIVRSLMIQNDTFALPSIYIAVIYGFAVFFFISPMISFSIYLLSSTAIILLLPVFHPQVVHNTYVEDIVTNNITAWIASVINFRRYVNEYRSQQTIYRKNEELLAQTDKIQKTNQRLQYISNMDSLTNIYNRRKLNEFLKVEYNRCREAKKEISLILMDVDFFKSVNDTYGHSVGDQVLEQLGELLKKQINPKDVVGRWGGEEFLIICPETDFERAFDLAEKIRKVIQQYNFKLENRITCSFGVATSKDIDTITNLIIRADKGLYKAKAMGRNRVEKGE